MYWVSGFNLILLLSTVASGGTLFCGGSEKKYEINEKSGGKNTEVKQAEVVTTKFAEDTDYEINEKSIAPKNQERQHNKGLTAKNEKIHNLRDKREKGKGSEEGGTKLTK